MPIGFADESSFLSIKRPNVKLCSKKFRIIIFRFPLYER